jgi:hypothetical protein
MKAEFLKEKWCIQQATAAGPEGISSAVYWQSIWV